MLLLRSTSAEKASRPKPGNEKKDEDENDSKGANHFHDSEAAVLPSATKYQALYDDKVSSE